MRSTIGIDKSVVIRLQGKPLRHVPSGRHHTACQHVARVFSWADSMNEWNDVVGFEGRYQVSSNGDVATLVGRRRLLKPSTTSRGYRSVVLSVAGRTTTVAVHRLVAAAFIGECPPGWTVNHINGIKTDNQKSNLEYVSRSRNQQHAIQIGLQRTALTFSDVEEIKALRGVETQRVLADRFGVTQQAISAIHRGLSYAWI